MYFGNCISYPIGIAYCEDFYVSCQLFYYAKKISKVNESLYCYNRTNESSITHGVNPKIVEDEKRLISLLFHLWRSMVWNIDWKSTFLEGAEK